MTAAAKESEKVIEKRLTLEIVKLGGWTIKLLSTFVRGLPDRLCMMPGGILFFVEVKSTGVKPTKFQILIHEKLRALGFKVYVIDTTEKLNELLNSLLF